MAAIWLSLKFYRILGRRVRFKSGELDIIARRGKVVAFVEVKARKSVDEGVAAVTQSNWVRVSRAASAWMKSRPDLKHLDWRYDLVVVTPMSFPHHFKDAWRPPAPY